MRRFEDRVAVVTGGGGAIGAATARRLAKEGARVVVVDRDAASAEVTLESLRSAGAEAASAVADVGDPEQVAAACELAHARFGRLDAVFNNAGISGTPAPIQELSFAEFDEVLRVNLRGAFLVLQAGIRAMIASGRPGAVVNMSSSMAGWDVLAGGSAYAASKHGVLGLTRTAALDAAPYGIRVNAVCPGVIETPLGIPDLDDGTSGLERFAARIPSRRVGQPADVAAVVAFLLSDDSRHVNGAAWLIDGGQTLQSWANAPDSDHFPLARDGELPTTSTSRRPT
jgi:NAD(P)-dependent dehydrogenase (short-subunit alcohol dehydrogenase family)